MNIFVNYFYIFILIFIFSSIKAGTLYLFIPLLKTYKKS
nr:MAG TPA: hypothetical protein [Caudoviricetes sp.]